MNKNSQSFDIYQVVTDQIIEILNRHVALGYTATWTPTRGELLALNPVSKTTYRGFNQLYLSYAAQKEGYEQNRWISLRQGNTLGGKVQKGQNGRMVTFWKKLFIDERSGKNLTEPVTKILREGKPLPEGVKPVPLLRYYRVFNLGQFEGLPGSLFFKEETPPLQEPEKDTLAEEFILRSGAQIKYIPDQGNCYHPLEDYIQLCDRKQFRGKEAFYKTAFHELGHWTGHRSRLNRELLNPFASRAYAMEELVAELFSAFVSAYCGFSSQITNNAAYIQSWLGALENDRKFVLSASSQAQKAADFAHSLAATPIEEPVEALEGEL